MGTTRLFSMLTIVTLLPMSGGPAVHPASTEPAPQSPIGACFVDPRTGATTAVREPVDAIEDADWLKLSFEPRAGVRQRLAILPVVDGTSETPGGKAGESKARVRARRWTAKEEAALAAAIVPVDGVGELLTSAVFATSRFYVVDRNVVGQVAAEQTTERGGDAASALRLGRALGAQFLIAPTVVEWVPDVEKKSIAGGGISRRFLGGLGVERASSIVRLNLRVIDATTGQVLASHVVTGTRAKTKLGLGGLGFSSSSSLAGAGGLDRKAPITRALLVAVNKAAYHIVGDLSARPWQGLVSLVDSDRIYLNAGSNLGLTTGMKLVVLARGKAIVDPDSGEPLGYETREIGWIEVVSVEERLSIARVLSGCEGIKESDFVRATPETATVRT